MASLFAIYTNNLPDTLQYIIPYKELKFILLTGFDKSYFPHAQQPGTLFTIMQ